MMKTLIGCCYLFALVLLMGCGGSTGIPAVAASPTPSPSAAAKPPPTTDQVLALVRKANVPVGAVTVYTAESDTNHLLGRPGQYVAKASWSDARLDPPRDPSKVEVGDGGGVEIFATTADRDARERYVEAIAKNGPLLSEYDYPIGSLALLRVSHILTPDQARVYQAALVSMG